MIRWLSIVLFWPVALLAQDQAATRIVTGQEVQQAIIERLASVGEIAAPNVMPENNSMLVTRRWRWSKLSAAGAV